MGLYRTFLLTFVTGSTSQPTSGFTLLPFTLKNQQNESPFLLLSTSQNSRLRAINRPEFEIGLENIPGEDWKRPGKVNQDAWFHEEITDDFVLVGVLDGHGTDGHHVSSYYASTLPSEIQYRLESSNRIPVRELEERLREVSELPSIDDPISLALMDSFHAVHWKSMVDPDQKPGRSGTTCVACLIHKKTKECHIAYVGDSKAILCIRNDSTDSSSASEEYRLRVVADQLTVNKIPEERKRIESAEGSIRGNNVFYGPVGIAMTRALGDSVMLRAGVIPTPMVQTFKLQDDDCDTLVLATDGIWDVLQDREVAGTVEGVGTAQDMAKALAGLARQRWVGDLPIMDEVKADDITVLVLTCNKDGQ